MSSCQVALVSPPAFHERKEQRGPPKRGSEAHGLCRKGKVVHVEGLQVPPVIEEVGGVVCGRGIPSGIEGAISKRPLYEVQPSLIKRCIALL